MKYLNIKLIRDVKNNWTQFFSVLLMAFLSVLLFVGLQGAWKGLDVSLNRYSHETHLANYWIQAVNIRKKDIKELSSLTGINDVSAGIKIQAQNNNQQIQIEALNNLVTHPVYLKGEKFGQNKSGIWLNKEYASQHHIRLGQTIPLKYQGQKAYFVVKGIIQSSSKIYFTGTQNYIAPNYAQYGYAFVPLKYLKNKFPIVKTDNYLEINGHHQDMRKAVEHIFGSRLLSYDNRSTLTDVATAFERVDEIKNLSYLFSFIFVLLAILAMFTTIRRLIEDQMSEIAVLEALGFKKKIIRIHYGSFGLLVGGLGAILGLICSPLVSIFVLSTQKTMFSLPHWQLAYTFSAIWLVMLVIFVCVGSAYWAAGMALHELPAEALRGKDEKQVHHIFLERFKLLWHKLPYGVRWTLRDAFLNKVRMLMGIIGVAGGMMLMIAGLGMPQSINHLVKKTYNQDYSYSKNLTVNNYSEFIRTHPDTKGQWLQTSQAHFSKDDGYNRLLFVLGHGHCINLKTIKGKKIQDGGIYVTRGFAQKADIKKGSKLKVKTFGGNNKHVFKVKGIIDSEVNQGAYLTASTWKNSGGTYQPTTLLIDKNTKYPHNDISSVTTIKSQKANATNFVNNLMGIFALIIAFAVILIVVVLYNLGSLEFVERYRDYATLRVLGIHKKELRNLAVIENLITTFIGWMIGIPAGIWFLGKYVATFTTLNIEYVSYVNWFTLGLASVFVWLCSMSTTLFLNRRIRKINMVQALKGVE